MVAWVVVDQVGCVGSHIFCSDAPGDYACMLSVTSDTGPCDYALVAAVGATDVGIIGGGIVNGGANDPPGHLVAYYNASINLLVPSMFNFTGCSGFLCRPKLVVFRQCADVVVDGAALVNSPLWTLTFSECDGVVVHNATISGSRQWPNNDGIDVISSSNVEISECTISTGDDCIALITHTPLPVANVSIHHCNLASTSAAVKVRACGPCRGAAHTAWPVGRRGAGERI